MEPWRHLEARGEDFQQSCSHQNQFFEGVGLPHLAWAGLGWLRLPWADLGWPELAWTGWEAPNGTLEAPGGSR